MRRARGVVASGRVRFVGSRIFTGAMMAAFIDPPHRRLEGATTCSTGARRGRRFRPASPTASAHGYGSLGHGLLTARLHGRDEFRRSGPRLARHNGVAFGQRSSAGQLQDQHRRVERLTRRSPSRAGSLSQIAPPGCSVTSAIQHGAVGARHAAEVDANDAGTELDLTPEERAKIDAILSGAAVGCASFTPLRPAMEPSPGRRDSGAADRPEASACAIGVSLPTTGIENVHASSTSRAAPTSSASTSVWVHDHVFNVGHVFDRSAAVLLRADDLPELRGRREPGACAWNSVLVRRTTIPSGSRRRRRRSTSLWRRRLVMGVGVGLIEKKCGRWARRSPSGAPHRRGDRGDARPLWSARSRVSRASTPLRGRSSRRDPCRHRPFPW